MLTDTDRAMLHACRDKREKLTKEQRDHKAFLRKPHAPQMEKVAGVQSEFWWTRAAITALHVVEAEIRGVKAPHVMHDWRSQSWVRDWREGGVRFREFVGLAAATG